MCEIPLKISHPDGRNAQFGDAFTGMSGQYKERFKKWADLFQRDDFLYLGTDGKEGVAPDSTAFCLPYSGLYSMRSEWNKNAICLVLKCGPDGGWHCHPDNGTFELSAGGRILMPDAGCYIYSGDPENRAWFRQTKVHQTLTLDDKNLNYEPKLIYWNRSDSLDILVVENKSYENLTHRRAVFFVDKRYFVIVDEAEGSALGDIAIHFQLAPGKAVMNKNDFSFRSDFEEGSNVFVRTTHQEGLEFIEEEGQVSFEYTIKEPRPAFAYKINKKNPDKKIHFITLVIPYKSIIPNILIQSSKSDIENVSSSVHLKIVEGEEAKEIGYKL
jgi:heparan-sulfate lyase